MKICDGTPSTTHSSLFFEKSGKMCLFLISPSDKMGSVTFLFIFLWGDVDCSMGPSVDKGKCAPNFSNPLNIVLIFGRFIYQVKVMCHMKE